MRRWMPYANFWQCGFSLKLSVVRALCLGALSALFLLLSQTSTAQTLHKCQINGRTSYQQDPCPVGSGGSILITPAAGRSPQQASSPAPQAPVSPASDQAGDLSKRVDLMARQRRVREIDFEIPRKESEIKELRNAMNSESARLRSAKSSSANNLAGATWEQSISAEMQALATRYQVQIDAVQNEIKALREERNRLQN